MSTKSLMSRDVTSGLLFMLIGMAITALSLGLDFGSMARPGPGFFPKVLSTLLVFSGLCVVLTNIRQPVVSLTRLAWRPFILIPLSVVLFSVCIERIGLMPSVFVSAITATFALKSYGLVSRIGIAIALTLVSVGLFYGLLNLPIPLWSF